MSKKVIGAIDVGSHAVRMKIGQITKAGKFTEVETVRKIAVLGHDTFTGGKLSFESVDMVCDLLKLFNNTFADYGVEEYKAVATSAIREASNRDYIVDQIKLKTGFDIEVISNSEEQFLTHKAIKEKLQDYETLISEGAVIVVVGAGSIQITTYKDGILQSSQNVKMGALRVKEAFGDMENSHSAYNDILDEYISTNLEGLDFFKGSEEYEHLIAVGGEIGIINRILEEKYGQEFDVLSKKKFNRLYEWIAETSVEEIADQYNVKRERAKILLPSMMLFGKFLNKVNSNKIISPQITLSDGVIRSIYEEMSNQTMSEDNVADVIGNAKKIAEKFNYNAEHCLYVEEMSTLLFDKLKKLHGLSSERTLLRVAAVLQDIGKYISLDRHNLHSFNLIRSLEIFGLSTEHMDIVANIAYYHSTIRPSGNHTNYNILTREQRTIISKLAAILRMADALDRSHKHKIKIQSAKIRDKKLIITGVTDMTTDTTLEEWTFTKKSEFFTEVYGVTPVLKIKREFNL